jgi:guanylate kinase
MGEKGLIFVITAPSGTGKTTIIKNILKKNAGRIGYSVSHTTRQPRQGEVSGEHYYFVDKTEFERMIKAGEFIEWAVVYDQLYGTSVASIDRELSSGKDILIDLDTQGATEMKRRFPESVLIFMLPPSLGILKERLVRRSKNSKVNIDLRLGNTIDEIRRCRDYDFIIVNDDLKEAIREMEAIIIAQRANKRRRYPFVQSIFHL